MSLRADVPAHTRAQQAKVSDPAVSAWVSANAGAGKTTVLVRRVIRLLLAGNAPARILCLTFTKAAAANMANKVLQTLGAWALLDDPALDAAIRAVSALEPTAQLRARARRLFAAALETPGGLKVQTIHAFCDRVLHQFPFEAGVQAGFEVLDEVREADLLSRARQAVLIEAAKARDGELGRALTHAVTVATDKSLEEAVSEAVRDRRKVLRLAALGGDTAVAAALGLGPDDSVKSVDAEILASPHLPPDQWSTAAKALGEGARTDKELAERLLGAASVPVEDRAKSYLGVFFRKDGEARSRSRFFTKGFADAQPDLAERLDKEFERMTDLIDKRCAAEARERTAALLVLAQATIGRYEAQKRARGALDYDDLIGKTAAMFDAYASNWVLYKLDEGIDHVLIDEAQDTSPEQWRVIERLTEEFFAGKGAREDRPRTIFAVGDEKQSIFSFQGADPAEFGRMSGAFARRVRDAGASFAHEKLDLSFRSAPRVLEAIDRVFGRPEAFRGLSAGEEKNTVHEAIRRKAPALVEIWPTEKPEPEDEGAVAWDAPFDAQREASPVVRLAQRIADAVKHWTGGGLAVGDGEKRRAARAGDVIVLVRQRGPLFEAILQALKRAEVPVAGADRLRLADHIAVTDLIALGDALSLEADDLALACALKSPLLGLTEDELFALAHGRRGSLAESLNEKGGSEPRFGRAAEKLRRWRREAAALRPFDFYSRILSRDRGREHMLARLGTEAADALDEFLARALAYEQTETPSLTGFLSFLRRAGTEVKRDLEVESDLVRVMTVHGAKGLEAPIVVLADTTSVPDGRHDAKLIPLGESGAFVWALGKAQDSARLRAAREAAREAREDEYRRLLYVALTRAADALIVCGHEPARQGEAGPPAGCWYQLVHEALKGELVESPAPGFDSTVWRWRPEAAGSAPAEALVPRARASIPRWLRERAASPPSPLPRIVPSQFDPDDAPVRPRASDPARTLDPRRRGGLLHRLLRHLPDVPAGERRDAAASLLAAAADDLTDTVRAALADEAIRVIEHEALAELFGANSCAEVDFLARAAGQRAQEIPGRIDRFAVSDDEIIVADFKTGPPPRVGGAPLNHVQQLAIYCDALTRLFPGRAMRALLVWTAGPAIHGIEPERLQSAMRATAGMSPLRDLP